MSKGLKVTLMMVAIALIGYRAMAEAPVIQEIPDVVIADDSAVTGSNGFVYPDAINLSNYATDDATAVEDLKWSFFIDTTSDATAYSLNNAVSLTAAEVAAATVQNAPGATKSITEATGETDLDTNPQTVTFRNVSVSPLTGSPTETAAADSKMVTLFASDGTTWSQTELMVYTDVAAGAHDHLSPEGPTATPITNLDFTGGTRNFVSKNEFPTLGTVTFTTAGGLCVQVGAGGTNVGTWTSQYGLIPLTANTVYRLRVALTSDTATAGLNPLWDIVIDNYGGTGVGENAYGGDYLYLDNEGGANAPGTLGRGANGFQVWFAPLPVATAQWNTGAFTTAAEPNNDMRIIFRVLDADASGGYGGELDAAKLCMTGLQIDKFDLSEMTEVGTVFDAPTILQATSADPLKFSGSQYDSNLSWAGNAFTATPKTAGGWTNELVALTPGDTNANPNTGVGLADNWSIPWEANTVYKVEVVIAAPDALGASNPPDIIRVGMDSPTTEILALTNITPNMNLAGTPKTTAATYTMFFYSHSVSVTSRDANLYKKLRPRMDFICNSLLGAYGLANTGGVKVQSMKVTKIANAVD